MGKDLCVVYTAIFLVSRSNNEYVDSQLILLSGVTLGVGL